MSKKILVYKYLVLDCSLAGMRWTLCLKLGVNCYEQTNAMPGNAKLCVSSQRTR